MKERKHQCVVCDGDTSEVFEVREMMFGFRDKFTYSKCGQCGVLQLLDLPDSLSRYYPGDYYSMNMLVQSSWLKAYFKKLRGRFLFADNAFWPGKLATQLFGAPEYVDYMKPFALDFDDKILDVGCGSGELLIEMSASGFRDLTGVDAFVENSRTYENGVKIVRGTVNDLYDTFDAVMLHHAFEHMGDPLKVLRDVKERLVDSGKLLIRTPVVSEAWEKYGVHWVQIDAPRHLFIHTEDSIKLLANEAGFVIEKIVYDSSSFQFWASEQYQRDIPLNDNRSYSKNIAKSIFTKSEIAKFEIEAERLNKLERGDQACFYMRKK